jgi:acyl-CoA synthetase (AMP-forming)/AMP-acid ligase II
MMSVFVPLYVGSTVNFAESLETVQMAMREILPTIFLGVPRIWEKMLSGVIIRMKDASWLKRKIFEGFFQVGQQVTRLNLDKKPVPLGLRLLHGLGDLFLYRALKLELGLLRARVILSGAAPISPEVLKYFHSVGIPVLEGYGMTEQTGVACVNWPDNVRLGTVGKPLPGVEIQLAEDGEILIRCPHNFVGYYRAAFPAIFSFAAGLNVMVYLIIGGFSYSLSGPILGALIATFIPEYLRVEAQYQVIFTSAIVILILMFLPFGVIGWVDQKVRPWLFSQKWLNRASKSA